MLLAGFLGATPLRAQNVSFNGGPQLRVTVPVGYIGWAYITNNMAYGTNGIVPDGDGNMIIQPITLNVTGLPTTGVSYNFTNMTVLTNIVPFTGTGLRTNSSSTVRLWLTLFFDGSAPEGSYTFSLNATGGATNNLLYTLDVAHVWNGSTNAAAAGAGNWSDPTQWASNSTAGTNVDSVVVFNDAGGQSNSLVVVTGVSTNVLVNSIVDNNYTINSLRFAETNNSYKYHNIQINPGKTLTITGTGGFSVLRDYVDEISGISSGITVTFVGTNGAALVVTNTSANFAALLDDQIAYQLDLSGLDNFQATVNRFALGDARAYPNFWNLDANGYGNRYNTSVPRKMIPTVTMAKTNIIYTSFVGPDNYTNDTSPGIMPFAFPRRLWFNDHLTAALDFGCLQCLLCGQHLFQWIRERSRWHLLPV